MPKPGEVSPGGGVHDGLGAWAGLCAEHGSSLYPTPYVVRTAGGGVHLYFTAVEGVGAQLGAPARLLPGRARAGGYVVGAGSVIHGGTYEVVDPDADPVPLPSWLADRLGPPPPSERWLSCPPSLTRT